MHTKSNGTSNDSALDSKSFKHVSYLWDDAKAAELEGDEVGLLIYRSNLLVPICDLPIMVVETHPARRWLKIH